MNLKGILFDFNGTLFFDSDMHVDAFRRVFKLYGKPVPSDKFMTERLFGRTNETIYKENFNSDADFDECEKFRLAKENLYYQSCLSSPEKLKLADGTEDMLDYIKSTGIPYCMATGSGLDEVEFYIKRLRLDRWFSFDNIVYNDGSFAGKPAPDIYKIAAKRIGLCPRECLVFEDGTSGILAARRAEVGAVIAVYDKKYPSPLTDEAWADGVYHDHMNWKNILAEYGLKG